MPSANVTWPNPLTRVNAINPGQMGVPGTDSERGLRQHSSGAIFWVDPNCPWRTDQQDGTNPEHPMETVAAALAKCQPYRGDIVAVMANNAWVYGRPSDGYVLPVAESVVVTVPGVRIVGVGPSGAIGVPWQSAGAGEWCLTIRAMDVLVEGFAFMGAAGGGNGIYAEWNGTTLFGENLTVRHCLFDGNIDTAIQLEFAWFSDIHSNFFQECAAYGVYIDPAGSGVDYCQIHDNWFQNCDKNLALRGAEASSIYRNWVYSANAKAGALATDEGIDTTGGRQNMIFDNYLSCLLTVPANGDYSDMNSSSLTDAWLNNHCLDGDTITNP